MSKPHLQVVVGSVREGRLSLPVAEWAVRELRAAGEWTVELIDLVNWYFPHFDLAKPPAAGNYESRLQQAWGQTMARGDAYLFVTPEYNHGYSSVLKSALDHLYGEWQFKPASCVGFGNAGGARMIEALQMVFAELGLVSVAPATHILSAHSKRADHRFEGDADDAKHLGKTASFLRQWHDRLAALRGSASGSAQAGGEAGCGCRSLVIGLGEDSVEAVVEALRRNGWNVEGIVAPENTDDLPDASRFDIVAIGRGALGARADRFREALTARNPAIRFVDALLPLAVRQIEAAYSEFAGGGRCLEDVTCEVGPGQIRVAFTLGRAGRIGVTQYTLGEVIEPRRLATLDAPKGRSELCISIEGEWPDSIVVECDGAEFRHMPLIR